MRPCSLIIWKPPRMPSACGVFGVYIMKFNPKIDLSQLRNVKGTDYSQPSSTRTIPLVKDDGRIIFVSKPLKNGNTKLGKDVLVFDTLAILTCPNCSDCRKKCYAKNQQTRYPAVYNSRLINTLLIKEKTLFAYVLQQLERTTKRIVRIHSSGDFFSQYEVDAWADIAKKFPNIRFYGYTKTRHIFDFSSIDKLENINIVDSLLEDGSINFGNPEYIAEKRRKYPKISICPVTQKVKGAECMRNCFECLTCKRVLFEEHK